MSFWKYTLLATAAIAVAGTAQAATYGNDAYSPPPGYFTNSNQLDNVSDRQAGSPAYRNNSNQAYNADRAYTGQSYGQNQASQMPNYNSYAPAAGAYSQPNANGYDARNNPPMSNTTTTAWTDGTVMTDNQTGYSATQQSAMGNAMNNGQMNNGQMNNYGTMSNPNTAAQMGQPGGYAAAPMNSKMPANQMQGGQMQGNQMMNSGQMGNSQMDTGYTQSMNQPYNEPTDAQPYTPSSAITPQNQNGIAFMSGGVGMAERDALKASANQYNLKLTLAAKNGDYLSDTQVQISKSGGGEVLNATSDGPLFYAQLPAGSYKVSVTSGGSTKTQNVKVGSGQKALGFYYDNVASNGYNYPRR